MPCLRALFVKGEWDEEGEGDEGWTGASAVPDSDAGDSEPLVRRCAHWSEAGLVRVFLHEPARMRSIHAPEFAQDSKKWRFTD